MGDISRPWNKKKKEVNRPYAGKVEPSISFKPTEEEQEKIKLGFGKFNYETGIFMPRKKVRR
jgi:hypothetical protein